MSAAYWNRPCLCGSRPHYEVGTPEGRHGFRIWCGACRRDTGWMAGISEADEKWLYITGPDA